MQEFTAVFCLSVHLVAKRKDYALDDSPSTVRAFADEQISTG